MPWRPSVQPAAAGVDVEPVAVLSELNVSEMLTWAFTPGSDNPTACTRRFPVPTSTNADTRSEIQKSTSVPPGRSPVSPTTDGPVGNAALAGGTTAAKNAADNAAIANAAGNFWRRERIRAPDDHHVPGTPHWIAVPAICEQWHTQHL